MYGLIHNNAIKVGPRTWSYSFFNQYLVDNNLDNNSLPRNNPNGPIITSEWKILPVNSVNNLSYNDLFEQLSGPFWTIYDDYINGEYTVVDLSVEASKSKLKEIITSNRYAAETGELKFTFPDEQEVFLFTSREDRSTYLDAYLIMNENDTITFKFMNGVFKPVTKEELGQIVTAGANHIKLCFEWESNKYNEIDLCNTLEELKLVNLQYTENI